MGAFGDKLRREREMRGVTLAEMSESTKISRRWLQALEDEQFDILPGGVFNRGFVRSYARFLGLNEEQAVADYAAANQEQPPPDDKFPLEIHEKTGTPPLNPRRSFLPVVLAVVALVLVVGGWTWWVKHKPQTSAHNPDARQAHVAQPSSPATSSQPPVSTSSLPTPDGQPSPAKTPSQSSPDASKESSPSPQDGSGQKNTPAKAAKTPSPNQDLSTSFTVFIKAKEDSWVSIVADGKPAWEGVLDANMERSVRAGKELVLRTGNAGGLEISYNGKPLGALGKEKQVKTLTFNTAGLQQ